MADPTPATPPQRILVPVDFGDASARAVRTAGAIGRRCGATVRVLHAEPPDAPAYFTHEQVQRLQAQRQQMRAQAEAYLGRFARQHTSHPFTTVIDEQPPADAILHHAASADLVVMGTHGRRGPSRWWLGSVAERVLREIDRPLLIMHGQEQAEEIFARVLVHAAAPLVGDTTLAYVRAVAACFDGTVVDGRYDPIDAGLARARATLLAAAAPRPAQATWLSNIGEPLVRLASVPTLFVPEPVRHPVSAGAQR